MPIFPIFLYGALAQLVERLHGMQEVRSSTLLCSTILPIEWWLSTNRYLSSLTPEWSGSFYFVKRPVLSPFQGSERLSYAPPFFVLNGSDLKPLTIREGLFCV